MHAALLENSIAPEQARFVLPQAMMTTWVWKGSLLFFARVCRLRQDGHAQAEAQEVANMIAEHCARVAPVSWAALRVRGCRAPKAPALALGVSAERLLAARLLQLSKALIKRADALGHGSHKIAQLDNARLPSGPKTRFTHSQLIDITQLAAHPFLQNTCGIAFTARRQLAVAIQPKGDRSLFLAFRFKCHVRPLISARLAIDERHLHMHDNRPTSRRRYRPTLTTYSPGSMPGWSPSRSSSGRCDRGERSPCRRAAGRPVAMLVIVADRFVIDRITDPHRQHRCTSPLANLHRPSACRAPWSAA